MKGSGVRVPASALVQKSLISSGFSCLRRRGRLPSSRPKMKGIVAGRRAHRDVVCRQLGIRHLCTRAYRPQADGKAERFIRTMLSGWAYGAIYRSSQERTAALDGWLHYYNHQHRHSALSHRPPIARLNERTNLPASYS